MNRRQFLKGLTALGVAFPSLNSIDFGNDDVDDLELTNEQIEIIEAIENIELVDYSPYHLTSYKRGEEVLYRVWFRDSSVPNEYTDIRQLWDDFGEIVKILKDKFDLPEVYNYLYDYNNPDGSNSPYHPPWWNS